jgi:hypothetical protein
MPLAGGAGVYSWRKTPQPRPMLLADDTAAECLRDYGTVRSFKSLPKGATRAEITTT